MLDAASEMHIGPHLRYHYLVYIMDVSHHPRVSMSRVASPPHFYMLPHDSVALYFQGPSSTFLPFTEVKMGM